MEVNSQNTLEKEINTQFKDDTDDIVIQSALQLYRRSHNAHTEKENQVDSIKEQLMETFEISEPSTARKLPSFLLHNIIFGMSEKMRPLDYELKVEGLDSDTLGYLQSGLNYIIEKSGLVEALTNKWGIFDNILAYGDAFLSFGFNPGKGKLPKFRNTSSSRIYVDPFATKFRSPTSENDVEECLVKYTYSWDEFCAIYPDMEDKATAGPLPFDTKQSESFYTDEQEAQIKEREIEVGHYYNKTKKVYCVFAGKGATIIEKKEDGKYPFIKDKEAYIPVVHFMCFPSMEGFYNYGIGHKVYKLGIIDRQLRNMALNYVQQNINPVDIVNIANGTAEDFFAQHIQALQLQAVGEKGYIVNEINPGDTSQKATVESFRSDPLTQEYERIKADLTQELSNMGIILSAETDANKTARALLLEEENKSKTIVNILQQNASEFKFLIELLINYIKESISEKDDTPIIIEGDVNQGLSESITLGDVSQMLNKYDVRVKILDRSGSYKNEVTEMIRLNSLLNYLAPGTPGQAKVIQKISKIYGVEITPEELGAAPQGVEDKALQTQQEGDLMLGNKEVTI